MYGIYANKPQEKKQEYWKHLLFLFFFHPALPPFPFSVHFILANKETLVKVNQNSYADYLCKPGYLKQPSCLLLDGEKQKEQQQQQQLLCKENCWDIFKSLSLLDQLLKTQDLQ